MRRLALALVAVASMALLARPCVAADAAAYASAVGLYEQRDYAGAERAFRDMLAHEGGHPAVLQGLGSAAYRQGKWVEAAWAFEWALRLAPGDEALEENLALARAKLVSDVFPTAEPESTIQAREALAGVPGRWSLVAGLAAWTLGWLLLALRQRGRLEGWTWMGVALLLAALPCFGHAAWQRERLVGRVEGMLRSPEVTVRSGPGDDYQVLYTLHAGTVVEAVEERAGWQRVVLPSSAEGWVPKDDVALFAPPSAR